MEPPNHSPRHNAAVPAPSGRGPRADDVGRSHSTAPLDGFRLLQDGLNGSSQCILLGLCFGQILAQRGEVGLDLRLGAGGADHDGGTILQRVDQDVGRGQTGLFGLLVVGDLDDLVASQFGQRPSRSSA